MRDVTLPEVGIVVAIFGGLIGVFSTLVKLKWEWSDRRRAKHAGIETTEAGRFADQSTEAFAVAAMTASTEEQLTRLDVAQEAAELTALAVAYSYVQRAVGTFAVLLPPLLILGNMAFNGWVLEGSISAYYYTPMGSVFVGALFALALALLSYNFLALPGFELDSILSTIASVAAVGMAVFPTASDSAVASNGENAVAAVHAGFAASLFVLLATFPYFLFTKSSGQMTERKRLRNQFYRACGYIIAVSLVLVPLATALGVPSGWHVLLWLETTCFEAIGVSWLVKSGFLGHHAGPLAPSTSL